MAEDPVVEQPTTKLRLCRTCITAFDPRWRVRLTSEPDDMDNRCPACGADLTLNPHIRRADDGEIFPHEEK